MKPNVFNSAVVAVRPAVLTLQVRRSGGRSEGIRPQSVSGRTGCSKKWPKRSEQRSHKAASTMASCTHIALVRAISHPWWRTAPWSTQSGGTYAHVFMAGDGVGRPRRAGQLPSLLVRAQRFKMCGSPARRRQAGSGIMRRCDREAACGTSPA
jgi:hypothetical protein